MKVNEIGCPNCDKMVFISDKMQDLLFKDNPKIIGIACESCNAVLSKEYICFNIYHRVDRKRR